MKTLRASSEWVIKKHQCNCQQNHWPCWWKTSRVSSEQVLKKHQCNYQQNHWPGQWRSWELAQSKSRRSISVTVNKTRPGRWRPWGWAQSKSQRSISVIINKTTDLVDEDLEGVVKVRQSHKLHQLIHQLGQERVATEQRVGVSATPPRLFWPKMQLTIVT